MCIKYLNFLKLIELGFTSQIKPHKVAFLHNNSVEEQTREDLYPPDAEEKKEERLAALILLLIQKNYKHDRSIS